MTDKLRTRNTIMAIVEETTEGVPVAPSAGTDFIAIQEGITVSPEFEELTNAEFQGSIGTSKNVLGLENPSASISHYMRHSGVEGQAPNYGLLVESVLGASSTNSTERTTAAASTTSLVKLAAGGSDFARGKAMLVKDSTNGYSIRNVLSVATNDVSLAQNLAVAPGAGVNTGKCINYSVANENHPTFTLWDYRANGGAVQMIAGSRVVSLSVSAPAAEFINGSFSIEGVEYFFDPIEITATNKYIDFSDTTPTVFAVAVVEGMYKDPYELESAIQTALNGAGSVDTFTVTYSDSTRKYTIVSDGTTFSLLWNTGVNTANGIHTTIGFSSAADDTAALTYTSDSALSFAAPYTPSYDTAQPLVAKSNQVMIGEADEYICFGAQSLTMNVTNTKADITDICSTSGKSGTQFTSRSVTVDVVAYLNQGQSEEFKRYRANDEIMFTFTSGNKSGGNWVAGTCVNYFMPTARISAFNLDDSDGVVTLNMTLQAFVSSGQDEFFMNYL